MLVIETKPLSINTAYPTGRNGRRFLTPEGKQYKALIELKSRYAFPDFVGCADPIRFSLIVYGPILTKSGALSKTAIDLDNCVKLIQDAVCAGIGVDDSLVTSVQAEKLQCDEWGFIVQLDRTSVYEYDPERGL